MKTKIYKVNGHTFYNPEDVIDYLLKNNFMADNSSEMTYKGKTIVLINVVSKK